MSIKRFQCFVIKGNKTSHKIWPSGTTAICGKIISYTGLKIFYYRRPSWARPCVKCDKEVSRLYKYLNS